MCTCLLGLVKVCCKGTGKAIISVPYCSLLGLLITFVGMTVALSAKGPITASMKVVGLEGSAKVLDYVWLLFFGTLLVNAVVAFQAFSASGVTRELLYAHSERWCCWCCQHVIGVPMQVLTFVILMGTFLTHLICVYVVAVGLVLLAAVSTSCSLGHAALGSFVDVLNRFTFLSQVSSSFGGPSVSTVSIDVLGQVEYLCSAGKITDGFAALTVGGVMCLLAQVFLLVVTFGNIIKVCHTMEKQDVLHKETAGYDST